MKLSIFQLAQVVGWYRNFSATDDLAQRLVELGNLSGLIDNLLPDASPRPSDMAPADFVLLVADLIPKLIEANTQSLVDLGEAGKKFAAALEAGTKAIKAK